jgi:hypothetical protein
VLGLSELRELTSQPKYEVADARSIFEVKRPEKLNAKAPWDIRAARNAADNFFSRCWSELIARGELDHISQEDVANALEIREAFKAQAYTNDFVIGTRTIVELTSPELWTVMIRAYNRWRTLFLMVEITLEEKPVRKLRSLFADFFNVNKVAAKES